MFALNETALLRARLGRSGGRPAYAEPGVLFSCRSEPAASCGARGDAIERGAQVRIFARSLDAHPGDRVELGGECYQIAEVRRMHGPAGLHHLEILAREA